MKWNARLRSRSKQIKSFKAKAASTVRKPRQWWKRNWGTICSLILASISLTVSIQALLNSQENGRREQSERNQSAIAVATLLRARVEEMETANGLLIVNLQTLSSWFNKHPIEWHKDTEFLILRKQLPSMSPTAEEIKVLAQTGDGTASQLSLCIAWRDMTQDDLDRLFFFGEYVDQLKPSKIKESSSGEIAKVTIPQVIEDTQKLSIECKKARGFLDRFSAVDSEDQKQITHDLKVTFWDTVNNFLDSIDP